MPDIEIFVRELDAEQQATILSALEDGDFATASNALSSYHRNQFWMLYETHRKELIQVLRQTCLVAA